LTTGWACQFRVFSDADLTIVDVYLPATVIGLDAILRSRSRRQGPVDRHKL
jgi:hypothetical protein